METGPRLPSVYNSVICFGGFPESCLVQSVNRLQTAMLFTVYLRYKGTSDMSNFEIYTIVS